MFTHYFFEKRAVYEIMWKNIVEEYATDDKMLSGMRIACRITKATNTHSEHVIIIVFPLQQWMQERASMLRYTYIACLVIFTE